MTKGYTLLTCSVINEDLDSIKFLIAKGVDVNMISRVPIHYQNKETPIKSFELPISLAFLMGHLDIAELLISEGADISQILEEIENEKNEKKESLTEEQIKYYQWLKTKQIEVNEQK